MTSPPAYSPPTPASSSALWSSADLLARCKLYARRPAVDESMSDPQWYMLLTEANAYWVARIAAVSPEALYGPMTTLETADGGLSYTFGVDPDGNQIVPIGRYEVRQYPTGREFIAGAEWDQSSDFVDGGWRIYFPGQVARSYPNICARWVTPGGTVSAAVQPTIVPAHANILLVYNALARWARLGGTRDPSEFEAMENKEWWGDPSMGTHGLCIMFQTRALTQGAERVPTNHGRWWTGLNTGAGYAPFGMGSNG